MNYCPRYPQLFELNKQSSPTVKQKVEETKELFDYLREHTGLAFTGKMFEEVAFLNDILTIELQYNKKLPEWTAKVFPHPIKELHDFAYAQLLAPNTEMRRLRGGLYKSNYIIISLNLL